MWGNEITQRFFFHFYGTPSSSPVPLIKKREGKVRSKVCGLKLVKKAKHKNKQMPQLIPFYFFNQILTTFVILFTVIYLLSKYVLPGFLFTQVIRTYITKLSQKN